jgi:hypothetical protein
MPFVPLFSPITTAELRAGGVVRVVLIEEDIKGPGGSRVSSASPTVPQAREMEGHIASLRDTVERTQNPPLFARKCLRMFSDL